VSLDPILPFKIKYQIVRVWKGRVSLCDIAKFFYSQILSGSSEMIGPEHRKRIKKSKLHCLTTRFRWTALKKIQLIQKIIDRKSDSLMKTTSFQENTHVVKEQLKNDDFHKGITALKNAAKSNPDSAQIHFELGNAYRLCGDFQNAVESFRQAIKNKPDFFAAYFNMAAALKILKRFDEALDYLNKARMLKPDFEGNYLCLGNIYMLKNDLGAAKDHFCSALRIKPDLVEAHYHLGMIMRRWGLLDEAEICYKNALRFDPGNLSIMLNYGECFLAMGEIALAIKFFEEILKKDPNNIIAIDNLLLCLNYDPSCSNEQLFFMHKNLCGRYSSSEINITFKRKTEKPLRIGYLSSDFCKHPSATILLPLFRYHDREQFQVFAYSQTIYDDQKTTMLKELADQWRPVESLDDRKVCEMIRDDKIDILVDCTGHMSGNRLGVFALRAAPIQISGIGYPNTTGLQSMDYRISDDITDPPDEKSCYTEKLLRLSHGFCCYEPISDLPQIGKLPCKDSGFITFGSTHTPSRLNRQVIRLWSDLLKAVPGSRLLIFRNTLSNSVIERLKHWFAEFGVDVNRVTFQNRVPEQGYLQVYQWIDVSLDTFPWSGHVTACESLQMGVPIITLKGNRFAGRMVSSVLSRVGLSEFIADTEEDYINITRELVSSTDRLSEYRATLREQIFDSSLCDCQGFVRCLEESYRNVMSV
jgi:protein O-GlcNAc transferase